MKKRNLLLSASLLLGWAAQSEMPVMAQVNSEQPPAEEQTDPSAQVEGEKSVELTPTAPTAEGEQAEEPVATEEENKEESAKSEVEAETEEETETETESEADETSEKEKDEKKGNTTLNLMHMNDTHAHVHKYPELLTLINQYRSQHAGKETMLLHAGDVFSGTLYFNEFEGQADLKLLNLMEIDALVFGNHEFDLGRSENGHQALTEFIKQSNFPLLGTNIDFSKDDKFNGLIEEKSIVENPAPSRVYDHIIIEKNGEKYGLFGLTTQDTKDTGSPEKVTFDNYIQTAKNSVKALRDAGINKIIAVTHLGFDTSPRVGSDIELAKHVEGIDIIVGGHSHTALKEPVLTRADTDNPTLIVQAGANADYLGILNVEFDAEGRIVAHSGQLVSTAGEKDAEGNKVPVEGDPAAKEILAPMAEQVAKVEGQEIGVSSPGLANPRHSEDKSGPSVRANETELGNLVTDAMLSKAQDKFPDTVIAVQNGGGIRQALPEGPITQGEIISILPFGNNPVIADLTGAEIKDMMEHSVRQAPEELGGFLHVSGMKVYYDTTKQGKDVDLEGNVIHPGERIIGLYLVGKDGKLEEIKPDQTYRVTTNGFTGTGGEHPVFAKAYAEGRVQDIGETDWMQLRDYIVETFGQGGTVAAEIEGRLVDLKGQPDPNKASGEQEEAPKDQNQQTGNQKGEGEADPDKVETEEDQKDQKSDKKASEKSKKDLPKTGYDAKMPLLIGGTLLIVGTGFFFYRRQKD